MIEVRFKFEQIILRIGIVNHFFHNVSFYILYYLIE